MTNLNIPERSCGHCKSAIAKAVATVDSSAQLDFDMENRRVRVLFTNPLDHIFAALKSEGYEATVV
ncbi:heavy-metal-associated domain-containing protein [Ruegeria conchae]|uniref:heavy-metal-associated domain-containing protein n=1 Tax=Ruegeria conchae TaxID=981384 RepID=UPI0035CD1F48